MYRRSVYGRRRRDQNRWLDIRDFIDVFAQRTKVGCYHSSTFFYLSRQAQAACSVSLAVRQFFNSLFFFLSSIDGQACPWCGRSVVYFISVRTSAIYRFVLPFSISISYTILFSGSILAYSFRHSIRCPLSLSFFFFTWNPFNQQRVSQRGLMATITIRVPRAVDGLSEQIRLDVRVGDFGWGSAQSTVDNPIKCAGKYPNIRPHALSLRLLGTRTEFSKTTPLSLSLCRAKPCSFSTISSYSLKFHRSPYPLVWRVSISSSILSLSFIRFSQRALLIAFLISSCTANVAVSSLESKIALCAKS